MKKLLVLRTGLGNLESQWKKTLGASKATCEISTKKIDKPSNSKPHAHFTEYSRRNKPSDLNVCLAPSSFRRFYGATDKPKPAWF
jgi:hypothetical protein